METLLIYSSIVFLFVAFLAFIAELWEWRIETAETKRNRAELRRQRQDEQELDEWLEQV